MIDDNYDDDFVSDFAEEKPSGGEGIVAKALINEDLMARESANVNAAGILPSQSIPQSNYNSQQRDEFSKGRMSSSNQSQKKPSLLNYDE